MHDNLGFVYCLGVDGNESVQHGDAGDAVPSPTLDNWPLFGQKFSTFGQITQMHSHLMR